MSLHPIRVMVVDDSAVIRGIWARILDAEPDIRVMASAWNGRTALDVLRRREIDVIILDIEMPEMSGLEALPLLLQERPSVRVIMASSLTRKGAEVTINALALGAADYVTKPSAAERSSMNSVGQDLVRKVRALAGRPEAPPSPTPPSTQEPGPEHRAAPATPQRSTPPPLPRRSHSTPPRALVVASSTGGPNALTTFLSALPAGFPLPILIVQHMPALFTTMLAERLQRATGRPCVEATDGARVDAGVTYVAPGDYHMIVSSKGGSEWLHLNQGPPENFCRPAADQLFRTAAPIYGAALTAVVLTGMGHDGMTGASEIVRHGGLVVAQDQATSVVWGMPGAVVNRGLAHQVLPLDAIAGFIDEQASVRR